MPAENSEGHTHKLRLEWALAECGKRAICRRWQKFTCVNADQRNSAMRAHYSRLLTGWANGELRWLKTPARLGTLSVRIEDVVHHTVTKEVLIIMPFLCNSSCGFADHIR
jgi:hypothetical protein